MIDDSWHKMYSVDDVVVTKRLDIAATLIRFGIPHSSMTLNSTALTVANADGTQVRIGSGDTVTVGQLQQLVGDWMERNVGSEIKTVGGYQKLIGWRFTNQDGAALSGADNPMGLGDRDVLREGAVSTALGRATVDPEINIRPVFESPVLAINFVDETPNGEPISWTPTY